MSISLVRNFATLCEAFGTAFQDELYCPMVNENLILPDLKFEGEKKIGNGSFSSICHT
jgi:hypothetical protein